ncbi:MAG: hypothetical protein ABSF83_07410 [Nitrososphaerales archaeon]|jgi:hypothetical protein
MSAAPAIAHDHPIAPGRFKPIASKATVVSLVSGPRIDLGISGE